MFFTQEDYKKIQTWLNQNAIKDSEFKEASLPLNEYDIISFVQNGNNVKVRLKDFLEQLFLLREFSDFINVTDKYKAKYILLKQAIQLVPYNTRKIGQVITFLNEEKEWKIYQFKGESVNQWNEESLWEDIVKAIQGSDLVADEEDLTEVVDEVSGKSLLKLKDKAYDLDNFSGLGRVILRKNIVTVLNPDTQEGQDINLLTQQMINKPNTIYEIQYDFDLNNQEITIPEGCVLDFKGGSLSNGKIIFNYTYLLNIVKINCLFDGLIRNDILEIKWFGKENDINFDNSIILEKLCILAAKYEHKKVYINSGIWYINKCVNLPNENFYGGIEIFGNKQDSILKAGNKIKYILGTESNAYFTHRIYNITLDGNRTINYYNNNNFIEDDNSAFADYGIYNNFGYIYAYLDHIKFKNFNKWCIKINNASWGLYIDKCIFGSSGGGLCIKGTSNGNIVTNCEFNTIKYIGAFLSATYNYTINSNIFEIIGNAGLIVSSYSGGGVSVNNNYFELVTINGLNIKSGYSDNPIPENTIIHSNIFIGSYKLIEDFNVQLLGFFAKGYCINSNTFQVENEQEHCIFGGKISNSEIKNNISDKYCYLIGFLWKHPFVEFENINISHNVDTKNNLLIKFHYLIKDIKEDYVPRIFFNIYSEDPLTKDIYKFNVLNHSVFYFSGELTETDEYYNGDKVFLCTSGGYFNIGGKLDSIGSNLLYWNEAYVGKLADFYYNINQLDSDKWNEQGVTIELKSEINIVNRYLNIGDKITLPKCCIIGEGDYRKEKYTFKVYSKAGNYPYNVPGFKLKDNNISLIENHDAFKAINGKDKLIFNTSIYHGEKNDIKIPWDFKHKYKGLTVYSETDNNILIYNGNNKWLSVNGDSPNAKGEEQDKSDIITKQNTLFYNQTTKRLEFYNGEKFESLSSIYSGLFNDKPNLPSIGFNYFCTDKQTTEGATNGIMIYHKGNNVWVDALGRIVE